MLFKIMQHKFKSDELPAKIHDEPESAADSAEKDEALYKRSIMSSEKLIVKTHGHELFKEDPDEGKACQNPD